MKRTLDILGSLAALILLSPVFVLLFWRIRRDMGAPVLFRQVRPGRNGKPFEMLKFRTMKDAIDAQGNKMFPVGRGQAGERQREYALRFGVNLIMHVLTGNYKSDQVHVPALLDRLGQ
jgi:lipopolysaccharide/colanic/teichoic acid biosynthesis glycosyltransferase